MSKTMKSFTLGSIVFMSVFVFSLHAEVFGGAQEEFHNTYTLKPGSALSVENTNGSVSVTGWDENYVDVYAIKKTNKDENELEKVEIQVSKNGNLSIETYYIEKRARVSVDYTIKAPKTIEVTYAKTTNGEVTLNGTYGDTYVKSTNGALRIENADGFIEAHTTNGNITLARSTGIKSARTTNGSIHATFLKLAGDVEIKTTNGSIKLTIPDDLDADVDLKTTNGSIKAKEIPIMLDEISKRRITGRIGSGGKRMKVKTTNGSITINRLQPGPD